MTAPPFALAPRDDVDRLAALFARDGVVSVPHVLAENCATYLHALLRGREDWKQSIASGDSLVELDRPTRASLTPEQAEQLNQAVYAGARQHFQFRYETIRVPDAADERLASTDPLAAFAHWWSNGAVRDLLRQITGMADIAYADLQATAYSPGDFLTVHTDDVDGKNRLAAYVLGLTPKWQLDWGGLLAIHANDGSEARALVPQFNRLNLFRVPRLHSVTEVTRIAPYRRYSLTGWLRY
jgi:Rps23 Pro-64 3,4-dihydroxylase Tpa1-like proline 4-hydroxylase